MKVEMDLTAEEYATMIVALRWEMSKVANRVLSKLGKRKDLTAAVKAGYKPEPYTPHNEDQA